MDLSSFSRNRYRFSEGQVLRKPVPGRTGTMVFAFALIWILLLPSFSVFAKSNDLPQFAPLNDWLYRGGQPSEKGFAQLKKKGIRTIVNFRNEPKLIEQERKKVEARGMNYVSLPWDITQPVKPELLDEFFKVLDEPKNRPVFFHCKYGRDRSGVMSTLALMRYNKLSEEEARETALETIHPNFRYRHFVNKKIDFFLKERKAQLTENASGG